MICEEAMALMSAKLDGALTPEQEEELAAHLAACPDCRNLMESLRGLDEKVSELRVPAPEGLKKGVLYRIDQATGKAKTPRRRWFGPGAALGAAAAVLVLLVGLNVIPLGVALKGAQSAAPEEAAYSPAGTGCPEIDGSLKSETNSFRAGQSLGDLDDFCWNSEWQQSYNEYGGNGISGIIGKYTESTVECPTNAAEPAEAVPTEDGGSKGPNPTPSAVDAIVDESSEDLLWPWTQSGAVPDDSSEDLEWEPGNGEDGVRPVRKTDESACVSLSRSQNAMVLLYTEFDPDSLFELLEDEEPDLYALVENLEPVTENGLIRYEMNCGTVLAIQEWMLAALPRDKEISPELEDTESLLISSMETLDPGSGSLYRVITLAPGERSIRWPAAWPADWDIRFRIAENWRLFFPSLDYVPNAEKPAYLVFPEE